MKMYVRLRPDRIDAIALLAFAPPAVRLKRIARRCPPPRPSVCPSDVGAEPPDPSVRPNAPTKLPDERLYSMLNRGRHFHSILR